MEAEELVSIIVCVCESMWCCLKAEEWAWLVKHELAAKLEAIDKHMEDCSNKFSTVTGGGGCGCVCMCS